MSESEKNYTPVQDSKLRQFIKVSRLFSELDEQFHLINSEFDYPYSNNSKTYHIDQTFLTALGHIKFNMYVALKNDGLIKEADIIMDQFKRK